MAKRSRGAFNPLPCLFRRQGNPRACRLRRRGRGDSTNVKIKIKICGITNLADALAAQKLRADALGFVFYPRSPRYIKPANAKRIIQKLKKSIKKVGVFVNAKKSHVLSVARFLGLDMLQFHGRESPRFCVNFKDYKVIKSFRIKDDESFIDARRYKSADYYLFDSFKKGQPGGTGRRFRWSLLKGQVLSRPFFVSGGLNPNNVKAAIRLASPDWVDASSGLEAFPGKKDKQLLEKFIKEVKSYEGKP